MDEPLRTQLRATLNLIPAHTWYAASSGGLTFVNERCADYLALRRDHPLRAGTVTEAAWDSHVSLLHPDDHEEMRRVWSDCLSSGSPGEASFRVRSGRGAYRWFLGRSDPLRSNDGTLLGWIGVNLDVEERKEAELYLAEGQRLAHTGSWAFNAAGFEYWSAELFRIHGLEPGGKAPTIAEYVALVHPEDRDAVARAIQKMLANNSGFDFTKRIVRPDGAIRHVRCVGIRAASRGIVPGFIGTGIDVTEQEQLTSTLREREDELRQVLDLTPQLVTVYGPMRERIYANRVALAYFGMSLEEWLRQSMSSDVHPEDLERLKVPLENAFSGRTTFEV